MIERTLQKEFVRSDLKIAVVGGFGKTGMVFREKLTKRLSNQQVIPIGRNDYDLLTQQKPEILIITTPQPLHKTIKQLVPQLMEGQIVIFSQNGILPIEMIEAAFEGKGINLIRLSLLTTVAETSTGQIVYNPTKNKVGLAQISGRNISEVANLFKRSGFETAIYPDYKAMEWTKLLLNTLASTGAVTGFPPYQTLIDPELFDLEMQGFIDRLRILRAAGIPLVSFPGIPMKLVDYFFYASFSQDIIKRFFRNLIAEKIAAERNNFPPAAASQIKKNKQTETFFYHAPFIKLGKTFGLRSPVDQAILNIVADQEVKILVPDLNQRSIAMRKQLLFARYDSYT